MAMGKRGREQEDLFVSHQQMRSPGHPFYGLVNRVLGEQEFDRYAEELCAKYYADGVGRPGLAPGVYFRCLLLGFFEGIDSERGIAWRVADSLSMRDFVGIPVGKPTPDHSTISRTRRLIDVETHSAVFTWVLGVLAQAELVKGKTLGVDATTLEANAAMKSLERRDDGRTYQEFLTDLAKASGIKTPTREDLSRTDRKRKGKKASNDDWHNPNDPDAQVTKMKDGRTHMGHKLEHAVDMDTGAVVGVTVTGAARGDTQTIEETVETAKENLDEVRNDSDDDSKMSERVEEVVSDKGYHSNHTVGLMAAASLRSYFAEPARGRRKWYGDTDTRDAVYRNRRRIQGNRGKALMRKRGELLERPFAHLLETGAMRRTHLRGHDNIRKRLLIHVCGFNLGLLMRKLIGAGTPRALAGRLATLAALIAAVLTVLGEVLIHHRASGVGGLGDGAGACAGTGPWGRAPFPPATATCATGC